MTRCKHDLPEGQCATCRVGALPAEVAGVGRAEVEATAAARFDGRCPDCGGRIHEGDEIAKVDGEWLCYRCAR